MTLTIVIPVLKWSDKTEALLNSIRGQNLDPVEFEVLFIYHIANGITFSGNARAIHIAEKNVSAARNLGLRHARGQFILFLDDDTSLPHGHYLQTLLKTLEETSPDTVCGGAYMSLEKEHLVARVSNLIANFWVTSGFLNSENQTKESAVKCSRILGGVFAGRTISLKNFFFAEELPWCGEDAHFSVALQKDRKQLFFSKKLSVYHHASSSWRKFVKRSWSSGRANGSWGLPTTPFRKKIEFLCRHRNEIRFSDWPLLFLHFAILEVANRSSQLRARNLPSKK